MENEVIWLRDIEKGVFPLLGEKSKSISMLYSNQFPVPYGFIVPAKFYNKFIEKSSIKDRIKILMEGISAADPEGLQARANEIQRLIVTTEIPPDIRNQIIDAYKALDVDKTKVRDIITASPRDILVAVRNDPVPGYVGQRFAPQDMHMSFLNVKGEKMLIRTIQACWASLYTAKAVAFRADANLSQLYCAMSVVIQRMIPVRKSGYLLTTNPTNQYSSVVQACLGSLKSQDGKVAKLSKYIVNTQIMDVTNEDVQRQDIRYFYDEDEGTYLEEDISLLPGKKPLENSEAVELVKLGKQVEALFGRPQQIEWAYYNKFYLLSSKDMQVSEEQMATIEIQAEAAKGIVSVEEQIGQIRNFQTDPAAVRTHEEVDVFFDEKRRKIIVEDKIEAGGRVSEKAFAIDPRKFLLDSKKSTISAIPVVYAAVEAALRHARNDFSSRIEDLLAQLDYHDKHELELLRNLKAEFDASKDLSIDDLKHAIDAAERFLKYLADHKMI